MFICIAFFYDLFIKSVIQINCSLDHDFQINDECFCEDRSSIRRYFYRKTVSRFNDKNIAIEERSREYTRKNDCKLIDVFLLSNIELYINKL